jgi:glycolate oxidase
MSDMIEALAEIVGSPFVQAGVESADDYRHDEALNAAWATPDVVVRAGTTAEVAEVLRYAHVSRVPVTARGSGTGLSGAAIARQGGILVSFERMNQILELDTENHAAVVQPGVTLEQLDTATKPLDLVYPVFPGENSASLGGNVNTNAGGMRAVKYGVTRHHVLGLEAVLATGEVIRTGGKVVKSTTGYDLTQLIIGSEGTLALVTEATLKLHPRLAHGATVLAPFATLDEVTRAVPRIIDSGLGPLILEYIDLLTMAAMATANNIDLGVPQAIKDTALAYLVVVLENAHEDRLDADVEALGNLLAAELGAMDVYVLPSSAAHQIIDAREKAFWLAKASGANDIVDIVVPRAAIPQFMATVSSIGVDTGSWIAGCGHAGDGNVHMAVFQPDEEQRHTVMTALYRAAMDLGGIISGEHGSAPRSGATSSRWKTPPRSSSCAASRRRSTPTESSTPELSCERCTCPHPNPRRRRRRRVLHQSRHVRDALRRRPRRGARDAGILASSRVSRPPRPTATPAWPTGRRDAAPPRSGPRQRLRQPAQRPPGPHADRQHRRRPRHVPHAVRRAARERHRAVAGACSAWVHARWNPTRSRRRCRCGRCGQDRAGSRGDADPARRRVLARVARTGRAGRAHARRCAPPCRDRGSR